MKDNQEGYLLEEAIRQLAATLSVQLGGSIYTQKTLEEALGAFSRTVIRAARKGPPAPSAPA